MAASALIGYRMEPRAHPDATDGVTKWLGIASAALCGLPFLVLAGSIDPVSVRSWSWWLITFFGVVFFAPLLLVVWALASGDKWKSTTLRWVRHAIRIHAAGMLVLSLAQYTRVGTHKWDSRGAWFVIHPSGQREVWDVCGVLAE